jgi:hypothetical protein
MRALKNNSTNLKNIFLKYHYETIFQNHFLEILKTKMSKKVLKFFKFFFLIIIKDKPSLKYYLKINPLEFMNYIRGDFSN